MKRFGFKMKLKQGCGAEYMKRHNEIWPDLKKLLHQSGIYDYAIFLDEECNILFGYLKLKEDNSFAALPSEPVMKKWWTHMKEIMETNPDNSPVSIPLKEMFYME